MKLIFSALIAVSIALVSINIVVAVPVLEDGQALPTTYHGLGWERAENDVNDRAPLLPPPPYPVGVWARSQETTTTPAPYPVDV